MNNATNTIKTIIKNAKDLGLISEIRMNDSSEINAFFEDGFPEMDGIQTMNSIATVALLHAHVLRTLSYRVNKESLDNNYSLHKLLATDTELLSDILKGVHFVSLETTFKLFSDCMKMANTKIYGDGKTSRVFLSVHNKGMETPYGKDLKSKLIYISQVVGFSSIRFDRLPELAEELGIYILDWTLRNATTLGEAAKDVAELIHEFKNNSAERHDTFSISIPQVYETKFENQMKILRILTLDYIDRAETLDRYLRNFKPMVGLKEKNVIDELSKENVELISTNFKGPFRTE